MSLFSKPLGVLSAALVGLATLAPATAQSQTFDKMVSAKSTAADDEARKKPAAKKKAAKKPAKPTYDKGSAETTAERTARLKRECKGGVNAGACAGYTR